MVSVWVLLIDSLMIFLLLIFIVFLLHKGRSQYSNKLLTVYFISQIIGLSDVIINYMDPDSLFNCSGFPIVYAWGPLFYFYMVSLFDKNFRIKWVELIHFLPFVVVLVYTCINYYFIAPALKEQLIVSHKVYALIVQKFYVLFTIQIIGYNIAVILKYRNYSMNLKNQYSIIDENGNNWLKISLFGFFIASLASQVCGYFSLNGILIHIDWFLLSHLLFLLFFIVLFYIAITSPHLVQIDKKQKYWYSALDASEALKILTTLEKYMEKSKSYLDSSLSLKLLAQSVGISERSLSQVINEFRKQNFFDYINTYRVKYAKELLKNPSFKQRTMLDILFESGFNSKSSFNTTFKKHTGRTPSEYRRQNVSAN